MGKNTKTAMVRVDRETVKRLKELQLQLEVSEGNHEYYLRDWHGDLRLSLDSVIRILIDRNDDHKRRSNRRASQAAPGSEIAPQGDGSAMD